MVRMKKRISYSGKPELESNDTLHVEMSGSQC